MMTKKILPLLLLTATFAACNNEENLQTMENNTPMSVKVTNQAHARALVETTSLPDASQIGVTLVDNSGTTYDGNTYNNLLYTLSGTEWTTANTPMLSATAGKAVAYYPYSNAVTDVTAIPVTSDTQTDYMYSGWVTGLHNTNPAAEFTMKHALSAVRIAVKKDAQYASEAVVADAQIQSLAFYKNATLDATTGTLNALTEDNQTLNREDVNLTLTTTAQNIDFLVVPGTTKEPIEFILTIGEKQYKATATTAEGLIQGMIHTFTLTLKPTGLVVSSVDVTPWGEKAEEEKDLEAMGPWYNIANGVYAVAANGMPVEVTDADESCTAVALITDNQRIIIAKNDATDGTNTTLYWGSNLYQKDVAGITESTDTNVAKTDFNGKANTAAIIAAYTEHAVEMNSRDMCKVLQDLNAAEDADWYVPSAGQLYEIYTNRTAINEALAAIGGTAYSSYSYWSSSEYSSDYGWFVNFDSGYVYYSNKDNGYYRVRFVQDIESSPKNPTWEYVDLNGTRLVAGEMAPLIEDEDTFKFFYTGELSETPDIQWIVSDSHDFSTGTTVIENFDFAPVNTEKEGIVSCIVKTSVAGKYLKAINIDGVPFIEFSQAGVPD